MILYGPKHTVESVVKELIEGLDEGTIVAREEELPHISKLEATEKIDGDLFRYRKKERFFLGAAVVAVLLHIVGYGLLLFATSANGFAYALLLISPLVLVSSSFSYSRTREKMSELRTYSRVLRMADDAAAEQLGAKVMMRLPKDKVAR
jgi:hypothetical protein